VRGGRGEWLGGWSKLLALMALLWPPLCGARFCGSCKYFATARASERGCPDWWAGGVAGWQLVPAEI